MTALDRVRRPSPVLMVAPHAMRTDAAVCMLAFARWARRELVTPPRSVLLASGPLQAEFRATGARVHGEPFSPLRTAEKTMNRLGYRRAAKAARLARHGGALWVGPAPRCIYASTIQGAGPLLRFLRSGTRLVIHCFEPGPVIDDLVDTRMVRRLAEATHLWIAASLEIEADLVARGIDPARIVVLESFIEPPVVDPATVERVRADLRLGADDVVIGGIGRADWRDGPDVFLRVASVLRRRHPALPVRFVWVGAPAGGPTRWTLEHDVRHAGLAEVVHLADPDDAADVGSWLAAFDVFCLTARLGPPPPVVLQAGALAVPVVGFAVSGMEALARRVDDPAAIRAVPYLDIEAMADALAAVIAAAPARVDGDASPRAPLRVPGPFRDHVLAARLVGHMAPRLWQLLEDVAADRPIDAASTRAGALASGGAR